MADNPQPNRPASGAYGERKELEDLKSSLPTSGAKTQAPTDSTPLGEPPGSGADVPQGRPQGPPPPPGVPQELMQPGAAVPPEMMQSEEPWQLGLAGQLQSTPDPGERLILFFDMLSQHRGVSPETREWAQLNLRMLMGAQ